MKALSRIILGLALTAPLAVTSAVRADDKTPPQTSPDKTSPGKTSAGDRKDVTIDQLPKAVKATVQRETKGKNIASITKSADSRGAAAYDIKVLDGAKETTLSVASDGKVTARKTGAAPAASSSTPPGANPTDANPPRVNSPSATSPSAPPPSPPPSSSPPPSAPPPSPPLTNSPSATSPSAPPPSTTTRPNDKKQEQRPNPPSR